VGGGVGGVWAPAVAVAAVLLGADIGKIDVFFFFFFFFVPVHSLFFPIFNQFKAPC